MRRVWRIGGGIFVLVLLVAIGLMVWEPLTAHRASPPPQHRYDVVIKRDTFGVPHIFGKTDAGVAYGIAYAHAEDDFPTLQEVMAATRGRLGALTGEDGARTDYIVHLLDVRGTVARHYDEQPADVWALLDGYAAGLNHYADTHHDEVKLSRLFPIDGRDVAAAFVLRSPFFFGLGDQLKALSGGDPLPKESAGAMPQAPNITPGGPPEVRNGSNAFAVAPGRSGTGVTRLVSNSHQPWSGAVAWYELVVHSGQGWDFAGATFPGAPYPLLGHNRTLGWTNTVNRPDLTDIYKLVLDKAGDKYRFDGVWRPLEKHRVWLRVRMGPFVLPVPKMVYRAVQGPVIENAKGAFAIRYAGMDELRMVEQYYRLNKARNWTEWNRAMALQGVPATNFIYADAAGNIGLIYNAMFPKRKPGYDYSKILPGDTSKDYEPGTVPWSMVPKNMNPKSGFIINANDTPYLAAGKGSELDPKDFSPLLGIETDLTNRAVRAVELMEGAPEITEQALENIKFDTGVSRQSWAYGWMRSVQAVDPKGDPLLQRAHDVLARWDWNFDGHGPADALAAMVMRDGVVRNYPRKPLGNPRTALRKAAEHLQNYFGRLDPPLGQVLRLHHGKVDLPLDGGPDVLRAMGRWESGPNGRLKVVHGDSFIMFMIWDRNGKVHSKSIVPYGAATSRPDSPHYSDQAPLFVAHRFKPVLFTSDELKGHVEKSYRP
ncbi:acylase [Stakelama sediminis]|uniref:Acyl-homoserine-lactone acylase n=1 Tax=Stakelama sediminis TaxID=463200 RepID=A0A840YVN4_9SPHN|nr:penicillin acylase family protein [Stakelama sediminis]MBB5717615.1 acyl-homoserine-lactone acylase [Stakelama sediminis]